MRFHSISLPWRRGQVIHSRAVGFAANKLHRPIRAIASAAIRTSRIRAVVPTAQTAQFSDAISGRHSEATARKRLLRVHYALIDGSPEPTRIVTEAMLDANVVRLTFGFLLAEPHELSARAS